MRTFSSLMPGLGKAKSVRLFTHLYIHLFLVLLVIGVSFLHYFTPIHYHPLHAFYQRLYYLPILAAAYRLGWRGGLGYALFSALGYLPHITWQWDWDGGILLGQYLEIVLFICIGAWVGALFDLTRRQADLVRNQQKVIEKADRLALMGQLAAGLAHEIRNPLNALMGSVDIVSRKLKDEPEIEFTGIMDRELRRMQHTLDEFLSFARPPQLHLLPHKLSDIINSVIQMGLRIMEKDQVKVNYSPPSHESQGVFDAQGIRQIILNLLMNARQHMPQGGVIDILHTERENNLTLTFKDTGTGIPPENLELVFNPFFTTRAQGTGLGLSLCRQLSESMGGSIKALACENGACIELTLLKNPTHLIVGAKA